MMGIEINWAYLLNSCSWWKWWPAICRPRWWQCGSDWSTWRL